VPRDPAGNPALIRARGRQRAARSFGVGEVSGGTDAVGKTERRLPLDTDFSIRVHVDTVRTLDHHYQP
jgi:hypothetical protein